MICFERHFDIGCDCSSVVNYLAAETDLPKQRVKDAMQKGAVWLERDGSVRRVRRVRTALRLRDVVHLYYDAQILAEVPPEPTLVADLEAYSVWYKPYGLRSQGSKWGDHCTIHRWVEQHHRPQRPTFTVHRLDRAATGLMLIAHQKRVATALGRLFEKRAIEKCYRVVVHGFFAEDQRILESDIDGRAARSHVRRLAYDTACDRSLLDVQIETGRKHQIRRHLSEAGSSVVGDRLYGSGEDAEDLKLTARLIAFRCPVRNVDQRFELPDAMLPTL